MTNGRILCGGGAQDKYDVGNKYSANVVFISVAKRGRILLTNKSRWQFKYANSSFPLLYLFEKSRKFAYLNIRE